MFQSKILVPSWGNAINYGEGTAISSRRNPAPPSFGHLPYPAHRYYQPLRDLNREDPVRELGRRAFSQCRNNVRKPVNNVKGSTKSMHNNPIHDNWAPRGESIEPASAFGPGHRASKGPCPTRCSAYLDRNLSTDNSEVDGAACLRTQQNMVLSPTITRWDLSPAMDKWSPLSDGPGSALHSADRLSQPDHYDAVETSVDKPYARLIHEALMQAPGHRMMLRDIYDWFIRHTTKPSESGTNGWQNSIRHNLSMNQAFENDRTDMSDSSHRVKKANSVWILTADAVRHGVQSTTRYRKNGSNKKANRARVPAPLRQRSGAKGGRAARRAARLRREEQISRQGGVLRSGCGRSAGGSGASSSSSSSPSSLLVHNATPWGDSSHLLSAESGDYLVTRSPPPTPESRSPFAPSNQLDGRACYYSVTDICDMQNEVLAGHFGLPLYDGLEMPAQNDACMKEMLGYACN